MAALAASTAAQRDRQDHDQHDHRSGQQHELAPAPRRRALAARLEAASRTQARPRRPFGLRSRRLSRRRRGFSSASLSSASAAARGSRRRGSGRLGRSASRRALGAGRPAPDGRRRHRLGSRAEGWRDGLQLGRYDAGPGSLGGGLSQPVTDLLGDPPRERAQQIVGDQGPTLGRHVGIRPQGIESGEGALSYSGPVDREQLSDLIVRPAAPEHELEDGALVGRKGVDRWHGTRSLTRPPV